MEDLALACLAAAAATLCIPGKANDPGGRNPFSPAWLLWAALFWALWAGLGTGLLTFNSELATLAPCSGKFGNTGEDCESLWSTELELLFPVPVWTEDKVVGTPNVEVVALLAACSVKKNRQIVVLCMYFCYFDTKFSRFFFFFFLHHSAYTSFLCTVLEVMQKAAADLADTPFSLLPAPHGCTTALLKQQLRWCTSSGGGAAHFQRPLRPLSATTDRFDQDFVQKSTCCVSITISSLPKQEQAEL